MDFTQEQLDFIQKASQSISDNPKTRLSTPVQNIIADNNYVFDAHCHVFDGKCINVEYMATRMIAGAVGSFKAMVWRLITGQPFTSEKSHLSTQDLVEILYNDPQIIPDEDLESALDRMEKEIDQMEIEADANKSVHSLDSIEFFSRYRTIIRLLRSGSMENVYKVFEHTYAIHQVVNAREGGNKKLLTVALGMDLNSGWKGSIPKSWEEQNAELATLSKNYPVIPYFPIDPRRENLYEEFLKAFDQSNPQFFGIKCYPSLGYLPADKQLMPIFKICEEKNIPVMAHCGGESVSTFDNPIKVNRLGTTIYINDPTRALRARKLNEPSEWEYVLKEFNDLRLCLGHFGGVKAWENHQDTAHRIPKILEMMDTYKNLYADFSYNLESLPAIQNFRDRLFNSADSALMKERTFFGTDFWVILPFSNLIKDQHNFVEETQSVSDELLKTNVLKYMKLL